jgi:hypothetical protein
MTMEEEEDRVGELRSKTQQNNSAFVRSELDACFLAGENGMRELEEGNRETAEQEAQKAEEGYKTVIGFVAELSDEAERAAIEKRWTALRAQLDKLQSMLQDSD